MIGWLLMSIRQQFSTINELLCMHKGYGLNIFCKRFLATMVWWWKQTATA